MKERVVIGQRSKVEGQGVRLESLAWQVSSLAGWFSFLEIIFAYLSRKETVNTIITDSPLILIQLDHSKDEVTHDPKNNFR
jgi:hypothetical protein